MKHEEGHGTASVLCSFFLGGIVGAGLALLLAPLPGQKTREKIADFADDVKEKAEEYINQTKTTMDSKVQKGKDFLDEKKSVIATAVEAGKEAYEKEKEKHAKDS